MVITFLICYLPLLSTPIPAFFTCIDFFLSEDGVESECYFFLFSLHLSSIRRLYGGGGQLSALFLDPGRGQGSMHFSRACAGRVRILHVLCIFSLVTGLVLAWFQRK